MSARDASTGTAGRQPPPGVAAAADRPPGLDPAAARRVASQHTSPWAALRWVLTRRPQRWPRWVESKFGPTPPARVEAGLHYVVVNHSTVLIQVDGCNLLTDPIYSRRCSPLPFAGPSRVRAPGLSFDQLPPIDIVLVSHNHYDHLDLPTLQRLWRRDRPRFLVAAGDGPTLRRRGIERVEEMGWWQTCRFAERRVVTFVPGLHFSGRGAIDRNRSLWGGYILSTSLGPVYYCGDSGYGGIFRQLGERLGPMALSFLPIGAYLPRWFMGPVHVDPRGAIAIHRDVGSRRSVGIHFGTFQLTDEGIDAPAVELAAARRELGIEEQAFRVPEFGVGEWLDEGQGAGR